MTSFASGQILTAAALNAAIDAPFPVGVGAWTAYTPTLVQSGPVTKTVNAAAYMRIGRLVVVHVHLTMTGAGTANNEVQVGLPVTAAPVSGFQPIGSGSLYDQSANIFYVGAAMYASTTAARLLISGGSAYAGQTGGIFTAALASTDQIGMMLAYQSAT